MDQRSSAWPCSFPQWLDWCKLRSLIFRGCLVNIMKQYLVVKTVKTKKPCVSGDLCPRGGSAQQSQGWVAWVRLGSWIWPWSPWSIPQVLNQQFFVFFEEQQQVLQWHSGTLKCWKSYPNYPALVTLSARWLASYGMACDLRACEAASSEGEMAENAETGETRHGWTIMGKRIGSHEALHGSVFNKVTFCSQRTCPLWASQWDRLHERWLLFLHPSRAKS